MGRDQHRDKRNKSNLPQTPKNQKSDGIDVEFAEEFADSEDKEAQMRSKRADQRQSNKK
ncbi:YfhD family protein [Gracilibacillus oryzae]|uniref:YfhD family protein n=1 Tax=Gracilibacillus oryzae TaxID=1672701 RepID=A0A7C8GW99_9BACI|nr:YfhD family protein [Gracilibacillus oryzae]KAB8138662.1 YfhD family protein [Gracilibacillus oryzae]